MYPPGTRAPVYPPKWQYPAGRVGSGLQNLADTLGGQPLVRVTHGETVPWAKHGKSMEAKREIHGRGPMETYGRPVGQH